MQNNQNKLDKYRVPEDIVFGKKWFEKHQSKLLWFLNAPVIKYWFRWVMRIHSFDCPSNVKITNIQPNNFSWGDRYIKKGKKILHERTTDFRTHDKYSKRLYFGFKYVWWTMHALDWVALDRVPELVKLSFGFTTLTQYPGSIGANNPVDGIVKRDVASESWATLRDNANANEVDDTATSATVIRIKSDTATDMWEIITRAIFVFDTSSIDDAATISATVLSLYGSNASADGLGCTPNIDIYTSTPASNTALANGDYSQIGTTSQTGSPITYAGWNASAYNDFTFNSTGRGNVSKTGMSKFGARNANYDVANTPPSWVSGVGSQLFCYFSENSGTTNDPKLVVTYSTSTAYTKELTEVITLVDTITKQTSKPLTEVVTLVDVIIKSTARTLVDAVTLVDTITKITSRAFTEVVTLVDTVIKQTTKVLTDVVTIVDVFASARIYFKELLESVTIVDTIIKQTDRVFTETVTLVDTLIKQTTKVLTDTVTAVDTLLKQIARTLTEEITLVDTITKSMSRTFNEAVALVDTVVNQTQKVLSETVTLVDSITRQISTTYTETITLVDTVIKSIARELIETVTVVDTFIRNLTRTLVETITLNDTVVRQTQKVLTDTITVVDNFLSALFTKAKRGVIVLLSRVQDKNVIQSKNKDKTIL